MTEQEQYDELAPYTLQKGDPEFIHQYAVDAFAAQNADEYTKPITIVFALAGLYLHLEKNYTGRAVQLAHIQMAKEKKEWPTFTLPAERGNIRVANVLKASPGPERDELINKWSESVWQAYTGSHADVARLAQAELGLLD